jgi:hypothetical protein
VDFTFVFFGWNVRWASHNNLIHPSKGEGMIEIIITIGVFIGAIWWACTANFDACEGCNHDCDQGRRCPHK